MIQKQKSAETGQKTLRGGEGVNLYPKTDETRIYPVSVANRGLLEALHACAGKIPPGFFAAATRWRWRDLTTEQAGKAAGMTAEAFIWLCGANGIRQVEASVCPANALRQRSGKGEGAAESQRTGRKGHKVAPLKEDVRITAAEHRLCRRIEAAHATHAYAVPGWDTRRHGVWEMGKDAANAERSVAGLIDWDAVEKANAESREEAL